MTSFHELLSTRDVPVVEHAPAARSWVAFSWLRSFAAAAAQTVLTIAVLFGLLATVPAAFGQVTTTVMSDSMEPGLRAGDVVVVRPMTAKQVKVGQVVLVDDPDVTGRLRLHRLVSLQNGRMVLKGDANRTNDGTPVARDDLIGAGWLRVPWIGLPVFWLRSGELLPLGLAVVALLAVAGIAASDRDRGGDGGGQGNAGRTRRRTRTALLAARVRRLLGSRSARTAGGLSLVLVLAVAASTMHPQAAAAFNSVTSSPGNSVGTGTFDCPSRPIAAASTVFYYSYMPVTGTAEPDVANGSTTYQGTLNNATRVSGNCSGNASPYVTVGAGSDSFVATNALGTAPTSFSIQVWFKAVWNTGVLASLGTTKTATPSGPGDKQIYFTSNGNLAFAMVKGGSLVSCSIPTAPTTGDWHLAVATYQSADSQMSLYLDSSSNSCTISNTSPSTTAGYWRFGSDSPAGGGSNASGPSFNGALDETAVFSGVISASGVDTLFNTVKR